MKRRYIKGLTPRPQQKTSTTNVRADGRPFYGRVLGPTEFTNIPCDWASMADYRVDRRVWRYTDPSGCVYESDNRVNWQLVYRPPTQETPEVTADNDLQARLTQCYRLNNPTRRFYVVEYRTGNGQWRACQGDLGVPAYEEMTPRERTEFAHQRAVADIMARARSITVPERSDILHAGRDGMVNPPPFPGVCSSCRFNAGYEGAQVWCRGYSQDGTSERRNVPGRCENYQRPAHL